ncbi:MAG: UDP-N-acetylglucosamine 2-epimerase, partial [Candidatus Omnitrophica bacterium]|nr:UDP-N-acetylglucosamine 2-epimerase [Candidatus Omnitrophota bacterium]
TNADTHGRIINEMIDKYVSKNNSKSAAFTSMGQLLYFSTAKFVDAIVGNSSSGIVEAPSFNKGTINIGDRQKGRIRAESVINCEPTKKSIEKAFKKMYSRDFQNSLKNIKNPYDSKGSVALKIKNIIKTRDLDNIVKKKFYEIN